MTKAKRGATELSGELFLHDVPLQYAFDLGEGKVLTNLQQLAAALGEMGPEVFARYVDENKNDFLNWIRYSVQDLVLAESLIGVRSQVEMAKVIRDRIAGLIGRKQKTREKPARSLSKRESPNS